MTRYTERVQQDNSVHLGGGGIEYKNNPKRPLYIPLHLHYQHLSLILSKNELVLQSGWNGLI